MHWPCDYVQRFNVYGQVYENRRSGRRYRGLTAPLACIPSRERQHARVSPSAAPSSIHAGIASWSAPASRHSCAAWRQTSEARSRIPATSASKSPPGGEIAQRSHRGIVLGSREFSPPHMMHRLAAPLRYDGTVSFRDAYRSCVRVSRYVAAPGCPGPHLCRGAGHVKPPAPRDVAKR
jgi:hypothetical protein